MVIGTSPNGQKVVQRHGELVSRVGINSLEQSEGNPQRNGEQMQITGEHHPSNGDTDSTHSQKSNLNRMSVLGSKSKGSSVSVVLLVNVLVEGTVVQTSVQPVVPGILKHKEQSQMGTDLHPRREGDINSDSGVLAHGVEAPDGDGLDHKVRNQHRLHALPLLSHRGDLGLTLDLPLVKVRNLIQNHPRHTSAKVENLMQQENEDAAGNEIVAPPHEIRRPDSLDNVESVGMGIRQLGVGADVRRGRRHCGVDTLENRRHVVLCVFFFKQDPGSIKHEKN